MKLGAKHEDGWLDIFTFYVLDQDTGGELAWTCGHITGCCDQGTGRVTGRHQSESSSVHVLTLSETHKDEHWSHHHHHYHSTQNGTIQPEPGLICILVGGVLCNIDTMVSRLLIT